MMRRIAPQNHLLLLIKTLMMLCVQSVKDVTAARQRDAINRLTRWSSDAPNEVGDATRAPPGEVLVR